MTITTIKQGTNLLVQVKGAINTDTAHQFETKMKECLAKDHFENIIFNFKELDYISSAGLRIILLISKQFKENKITIKEASKSVKEVFIMTGFDSFINII